MIIRWYSLVSFIFCLPYGISAQVQSFIAEKSLGIESDYSIEVFNSESGLPQNSVIDILQTADGYLWFSTFSGLVRFDGIKFTLLNSQNTKGIIPSAIVKLYEDKQKNVWLIDDQGHLFKFDGNGFTGFEKSFNNIRVKSLCFADDGTLFIANVNNEVYSVNQNILDFIYRVNQGTLNFIKAGKDNSVLIAASTGLYQYKNGTTKQVSALPQHNVISVDYDQENFLWVCTSRGIFKVSENKAERILFPDENFNSGNVEVFIDRQNNKWFYNNEGIYVLGITDFTQISEENGLSSNSVRSIIQDFENNIWVGTNSAGVNKLHYKIFKTFSVEDGLISDGVAPVMKSKKGIVYVGNNCGGINKIIDGKIIRQEIPEGNTCVWSLLEDSSENLWIGTYGGGLFKYKNDKQVIHYTKSNGLPDELVFALYEDNTGKIWLGTDKGVYTIVNDSIYPFKKEIIKSKTVYFLQDNESNIWIGTTNGLYYVTSNDVKAFTTYDGLPSNRVRCMHFDKDNVLWIGTIGGGLCHYKNQKFFAYKQLSEITDPDVFCITEDAGNNFWITTNRGAYSIKRSDLTDFADEKINSIPFQYYDKKDGLKTNEFNSGFQPNVLQEDESHIWFPTIKGVSILNTKRMLPNDYVPQIAIEKIKIDNGEIYASENFVIPRANKTLEIYFTAPRFSNPQKQYFQYKLEGYDIDWSKPTSDRLARYFNLKPGNYSFKVRLYGIISTEKNTFMQVPVPFWQTQWFLVLTYIAGFTLLALIAVFRIRRIRDKEQQKTELNKKFAEFELRALQAQMNPHFIFNCLNTIKYFITTSNHAAANKYLGKFSKLLRMFLDHSTSNYVTLEEEINLLRLYIELEQMRFNEGFNFHLKVDDKIDYKNIEIPGTLFQPFVENAINHGLVNLNRKGNLTLTFEQHNDIIRGIVDDDGIGRKAAGQLKESVPHGHISRGTQLIDDRIKTLNYIRDNNIAVEIIDKKNKNNEPEGTRIVVSIPIEKN